MQSARYMRWNCASMIERSTRKLGSQPSGPFMTLRRILQMLASFLTGQGITVIGQLLVPPFFLSCYPQGLEVYGEWIALSAAVTYLGTLNIGIQVYANNQMTILYNRGEVASAK